MAKCVKVSLSYRKSIEAKRNVLCDKNSRNDSLTLRIFINEANSKVSILSHNLMILFSHDSMSY